MNLKLKLVADWKQAHKWLSMQASFIGFVFSAVAASAALAGGGASFFGVLDTKYALLVCAFIFLCSMIGRVILQKLKKPDLTVTTPENSK